MFSTLQEWILNQDTVISQLNAGLVLTPGQNRYFLNIHRGRLIGVPVFIWGRAKKLILFSLMLSLLPYFLSGVMVLTYDCKTLPQLVVHVLFMSFFLHISIVTYNSTHGVWWL